MVHQYPLALLGEIVQGSYSGYDIKYSSCREARNYVPWVVLCDQV